MNTKLYELCTIGYCEYGLIIVARTLTIVNHSWGKWFSRMYRFRFLRNQRFDNSRRKAASICGFASATPFCKNSFLALGRVNFCGIVGSAT